MKRLSWLLFAGACLPVLAGCPLPAKYLIQSKGNINLTSFTPDSSIISLIHAHPWRDKDQKVIIVSLTLHNIATKPHYFICSQVTLHSSYDKYELNFSRRDLRNDFIVEQDTIHLDPDENKMVSLYFLSQQTYSRHRYKRSIEADTLLLSFAGWGNTIRLEGKWH